LDETYEAFYLPSINIEDDPSRGGFKTKKAAENYTKRHWCKLCRDDYAKYLKSQRKGIDCEGPFLGCDAEWMVCKEEPFKSHREPGHTITELQKQRKS